MINFYTKRRAGISLPLNSLLTKQSFECGDFYSLEKILPFVKDSGFTILQLLPLNDLGKGRSPYSSISSFAIDPIYISLYKLDLPFKSRKDKIASLQIDISRVRELKVSYLRDYYDSHFENNMEKEVTSFLNKFPYMRTYACFKILYDKYNGKSWETWQENQYTIELENKIINENLSEFNFQIWLQIISYTQLKEIKELYTKEGIFLKGDMPILTSRNSADVWSKSNLFHLHLQAGAPPDNFSAEGQNWGFPIFNWEEMKKENYKWWKDRLHYLENFFDFYRIDHVLGMYRIWAIPQSAISAKHGYYYPQHGVSREEFNEVGLNPDDFTKREIIYEFEKDHFIFYWDFYKMEGYYTLDETIKAKLFPLSHKHIKEEEIFWRKEGEEILKIFRESSSLIPFAEDLGAVPEFVRHSIHENKVIGLDIIRWTRSLTDGHFIKKEDYRQLAVSSLSVHDTSLILEWWSTLSEEDKKEFKEIISYDENEKSLLKQFLKFAFSTNSLFSIQLLQDVLYHESLFELVKEENNPLLHPEKHRINIPGTDEDKNWGYRLPLFAEDLSSGIEAKKDLLLLLKISNRFNE
jgi:4-alpha-glucanotransferase